jgi:hypothetical protein
MSHKENQKPVPQPLTEKEKAELEELKMRLFGEGCVFVLITDAMLNDPDVKRYDELMYKKMQYMAYMAYLASNN